MRGVSLHRTNRSRGAKDSCQAPAVTRGPQSRGFQTRAAGGPRGRASGLPVPLSEVCLGTATVTQDRANPLAGSRPCRLAGPTESRSVVPPRPSPLHSQARLPSPGARGSSRGTPAALALPSLKNLSFRIRGPSSSLPLVCPFRTAKHSAKRDGRQEGLGDRATRGALRQPRPLLGARL